MERSAELRRRNPRRQRASLLQARPGGPGGALTELLTADEARRVRVIKIDVEGSEAAVVAGMAPLLAPGRDDLEILLEVHPDRLAQLGTGVAGIFEVFERAGLPSVPAGCRWGRNPDSPQRPAFARDGADRLRVAPRVSRRALRTGAVEASSGAPAPPRRRPSCRGSSPAPSRSARSSKPGSTRAASCLTCSCLRLSKKSASRRCSSGSSPMSRTDGSEPLQLAAALRDEHAERLARLERDRPVGARELPVHREGRNRPVGLDEALERADAVFRPVGRAAREQVVAGRRAEEVRDAPGEDAVAEVARPPAAGAAPPRRTRSSPPTAPARRSRSP